MNNYNELALALTCAAVFAWTVTVWFWRQNLFSQKKELDKVQNQQQKKENELVFREKSLATTQNDLTAKQQIIQKEEDRVVKLSEKLLEKEKVVNEQIERYQQKEQRLENIDEELKSREKEVNRLQQEAEQKIWEISQMEAQEAQEVLFSRLKEKIKNNLDTFVQQEIKKSQKNVEAQTAKIVCLALEKYSSEIVFNKTVNQLKVGSRQVMGRIIGKDGVNINLFRKVTGAEVIIGQEKEGKKKEELTVEVSSFNSLRREIATRTLARLLDEKRISPIQIENVFQQVSQEVDKIILESGEEVLKELQISFSHPELVRYLGKLKFRTSYGQNVLEHSLEVAKLSGTIAAELNLDVSLAKRAGLLHDIGKAVEGTDDISHVKSGIVIARQWKESDIVINAIASHHRDIPANNLYSLIVSAADTLSAARPGARGQQLEAYISRMESLEKLTEEIPGIEKIYAFQAGREVWVMVDSQKVSDYELLEIADLVKRKICEQVIIPGEVVVSVLRENKITQKISTAPQLHSRKDKLKRIKNRK